MSKLKVVHYINQFFANIGGEEKADYKPELRNEIVGPGLAFSQAFGDEAEIVATVICGDSYFNENVEDQEPEPGSCNLRTGLQCRPLRRSLRYRSCGR